MITDTTNYLNKVNKQERGTGVNSEGNKEGVHNTHAWEMKDNKLMVAALIIRLQAVSHLELMN